MNLDPFDLLDAKREVGQGFGHLGRITEPDVRDVHPVADLQRIGRTPHMEAASADDRVTVERAEYKIAAGLPRALPIADQGAASVERQGLELGPRHPRSEMLETLEGRRIQRFGVAELPAAQSQPRCVGESGDAVHEQIVTRHGE